ncbi:MAG: magnesium transporter CorA family protein [Acidimicrobiia bacterium]|nr:MAG: magnesium transporter CorA family protein [Acidimicrobiia bacterium]
MQHLFHSAPGAETAVEVTATDLAQVRAAGGWLWLDVYDFTHEDVEEIGATLGFDPLDVEDVLDWSKFPKVGEHPDYTLVVGHALSAREAERLAVVEHDAFLGDGLLVTFHREDLPSFAWGRQFVLQPGVLAGAGPDLLWARMAEVGAARYLPLVDGLEERIAELEDRAVLGDPGVPADVLALRRDAQTVRQITLSQRDALRTLVRESLPGIGKPARRRLAHVADDHARLTEILEGARMLLGSALEAYRGTMAERANEVMKVLTVFAAIVLPLSLIAGVYGMNFAHMPELQWRWAYPAVLGLMVLVAVGLWAYFGRRGFIGGPRLGAVPGLVGRGLVEFVKLTAKPAVLLFDLTRGNGRREEG